MEWFLGLPRVNQLLVVAAIIALVAISIPGIKITLRKIVKFLIIILAAALLYSVWTGENPARQVQQSAQRASQEQSPPKTVPKYYEDPEKRWGNNL
jgi:flagellar basal body-associated protein FliL